MSQPFRMHHPEIDELFDRYKRAPQSTIFAPLADACRKAGMIDEALDICRRGLEANPTYASGYVVQGKCLYDAERADEAESAFRRVLELDSSNLVALKFLGIILSERGAAGDARSFFEHILVLDPEDRDIRRRLAEVDEADLPEAAAHDGTPDVVEEPPAMDAPAEIADDSPLEGDDTAEMVETLLAPEPRRTVVEDEAPEPPAVDSGGESVASDEIATITLADIYASQGYIEKALRIYREVQRRKPDDPQLRRKIDSLESAARDGASASNAPEPSAGPAAAPAHPVPEPPAPPRPVPFETRKRADESRNYEQFKRWLRNVSE